MNATAAKRGDRSGKPVRDTIMADVSKVVSESVAALMPYFGIRKLSAPTVELADLSKVVPIVEMFDGTPEEIEVCGNVVAFPLAELMAAVGLVRVELEADKDELKSILDGYGELLKRYKERVGKTDKDTAAKPSEQTTEGGKDVKDQKVPQENKEERKSEAMAEAQPEATDEPQEKKPEEAGATES